MVEWCIPFWVTLTLTLTFGLISRFIVSGAYLLILLQLTLLKCVLCLTNSFGGIRHVTVTFLVSNDPGHMTKMAAMPIHGRNLLKNLHSQNQKTNEHLGCGSYQVCSNDPDETCVSKTGRYLINSS